MKVRQQSRTERRLEGLREAVTERWLEAMTTGDEAPPAASDARHHLGELAKRVTTLLCAEELAEGEAEAVGACLAELLGYHPEVWGQALQVLARHLLEGLAAQEAAALQPRLASLLGRMAGGLAQAARGEATHDIESRVAGGVARRTVDLAAANCEMQREIAARIRAEETLWESENRERVLLNTPADAIALIDSEGIMLDANETMARRFGRSVDELIGLHSWGLIPPDLAEARKTHAQKAVESGQPVRFEDQNRGTWFDNVFYPVADEQGRVTRLAVWARDITQRKIFEQDLEEHVAKRTADLAASEARYRTLFENNADALFLIDMQGRYLDVNPAACRMLGYSREELLTKGIFEVGAKARLVPPDQRPEYLERQRALWRQGILRNETGLISKSGRHIPVETAATPLDFRGAEAALSAVRDISERIRAHEALQQSERELRSLYMRIPVPTYTWQKMGDRFELVDHNDAAGQVTQGRARDLLGVSASEFFRDTPAILDCLLRCANEEQVCTWEGPYRYATTGELRYLVLSCAFVPPDRVMVQTEDITTRMKAEEALRRSRQETLRNLDILQALGQAAHAVQRSLTVDEVYESIGRQVAGLGYRALVFTVTEDRSHLVLTHTSLKKAALRKAEKLTGTPTVGTRIPLAPDSFIGPVLNRGQSLYCERTADLALRSAPKLGHGVIESLIANLGIERSIYAPLEVYGEVEGVMVIAGSDLERTDVPAVAAFATQAAIALEHVRMLAQVRSVGRRLRRLAHSVVSAQEGERRRLSRALHDEAGQALTALSISLQLIRQHLPPEAKSLSPRLDDAAKMATETLDQLRLLARGLRPPALDAIGLGQALGELCRVFAQRTDIAIEYQSSHHPPLPEEVSISLYRLLQEALTNAARHAHPQHIRAALSSDGREVTLAVEDDGQGFDRESLLSDSDPHRGIGLLNITERLETLGGWLEIDSQPGRGTRLVGHIPLPHAPAEDEGLSD